MRKVEHHKINEKINKVLKLYFEGFDIKEIAEKADVTMRWALEYVPSQKMPRKKKKEIVVQKQKMSFIDSIINKVR